MARQQTPSEGGFPDLERNTAERILRPEIAKSQQKRSEGDCNLQQLPASASLVDEVSDGAPFRRENQNEKNEAMN
jgi:hypothetical protein